MKNIILLPLDERPCNFDFPPKIFNGEKYTIIRPEHLGQKKTPASYEFIRDFLLANIEKADAAVISIDTLLYGGLIPSRLHHLSGFGASDAFKRNARKEPAGKAVRVPVHHALPEVFFRR